MISQGWTESSSANGERGSIVKNTVDNRILKEEEVFLLPLVIRPVAKLLSKENESEFPRVRERSIDERAMTFLSDGLESRASFRYIILFVALTNGIAVISNNVRRMRLMFLHMFLTRSCGVSWFRLNWDDIIYDTSDFWMVVGFRGIVRKLVIFAEIVERDRDRWVERETKRERFPQRESPGERCDTWCTERKSKGGERFSAI